ncbi:hypothetical protein NPIL_136031 [Nephila pilipes]|uniref:Uncharacterized protein n=1 Tax=Nephila pilipes TaxID=299642 RepID=A0A8X6Q5F3_NEPPI|nr:hypothetical protein NPIL_136031 [Nephila pilipes]
MRTTAQHRFEETETAWTSRNRLKNLEHILVKWEPKGTAQPQPPTYLVSLTDGKFPDIPTYPSPRAYNALCPTAECDFGHVQGNLTSI